MRLSLLPIVLLAACSPDRSAADGLIADGLARVELDPATADRVLDVVNELDQRTLDEDVGLDARAAANIVAHRAGPDGTDGTADDDRFDSLEELDAVPYVGDAALQKLADWAAAGPERLEVNPVAVHGVLENSLDASLILAVANLADVATLDDLVGLDARAAAAIVEHRGAGLATLTALDSLAYVGSAAFIKLLDHALSNGYLPADGCPAGIVRDDEGTLYNDLASALELAPIGASVTLCAGAYGADGWGHYRDDDDLTLQGLGEVRVRGYLNFTGQHVRISGLDFYGEGGGLNLFATSGRVEHVGFFDRSHLYAVDGSGSFQGLFMDGASEFKLKQGSYQVYDGQFQNLRNVQDGFSPVFFQAATVRVQGSDFVNNAGGPAIKLSGGSSLDLLAVLFGSGGDANELGDIAVSGGQVYAGLGFVGDGVCSNDRGCTF